MDQCRHKCGFAGKNSLPQIKDSFDGAVGRCCDEPMIVQWLSFICFALAGLLHVGFFIIESILYQKKGGHVLLKVSEADHQATKVWAFNQGFYNLFLALGTFGGLFYVMQKQVMLAGVLTGFCGLSMIGAGIVLWYSAPRLRRGAVLQALPPLLGFIFLFFHITSFR